MANHTYSLRPRINAQIPSLRTTQTASPTFPRTGAVSPRKKGSSERVLRLEKVIGTTTDSPNGMACCPDARSFAYCAGAVAVLCRIGDDETASPRYYKARPTAVSLNAPTSHYDNAAATTPSKRRAAALTPRKGQDDHTNFAPSREWLDDSAAQTWTARERIKTASCVSLSRDGRWLAVGEAGYNPRVLIFSTADDAPTDAPTSIVSEHTHGVRAVAFSAEMKFLATLGNLNDGFLFIWSFNARTGQVALHSANKCTANICDMAWSGTNLITVGTRHIKVWQLNDPSLQSPTRRPKARYSEAIPSSPGIAPLNGRNCLLGPMVDSTFTSVAAIDDHSVLVGTDAGHVCLVGKVPSTPELKLLRQIIPAITSISLLDSGSRILLGTSQGLYIDEGDTIHLGQDDASGMGPFAETGSPSEPRSAGWVHQGGNMIAAVGAVAGRAITIDAEGGLQIQDCDEAHPESPRLVSGGHHGAVIGVESLPIEANLGAFFTWSLNGEVKFWSPEGALLRQETVALDDDAWGDDDGQNQLTRLRFCPSLRCFLVGDRWGFLKSITAAPWAVEQNVRAHSADITCIDTCASGPLAVSCSRDRTVQVFQIDGGTIQLQQTIDDHMGSVSQVLFCQGGQKLLTASADRSLILHDRVSREDGGEQSVAFVPAKVITLKSTPLSMAMSTDDTALVATMDRRITKMDISTGTLGEPSKIGNADSDETVMLNSILCTEEVHLGDSVAKLLIGFCATDKSIRIYNKKNLALLDREAGHTEGVSDLTLLPRPDGATKIDPLTFVTTGLDGTIMMWRISRPTGSFLTRAVSPERPQRLGILVDHADAAVAQVNTSQLPPLRKVLTKMDLAELTAPCKLESPSARSPSPARLTRKASNRALATTAVGGAEGLSLPRVGSPTKARSVTSDASNDRRSPSPGRRQSSRSRSRRARTTPRRNTEFRQHQTPDRSPSPVPARVPRSVTPQQRRKPPPVLSRRPPSIPSELRVPTNDQALRSGMILPFDFGAMEMAEATEQTSQMLRSYNDRLSSSMEVLDLDDLEHEVHALVKTIEQRKRHGCPPELGSPPASPTTDHRREPALGSAETDLDRLATLMERSRMTDSPSTTKGTELVEASA